MYTQQKKLSPKILIFIFLTTFVCFNANLIPRPNSDAISSELLPFSLIINHTIFLDEFRDYYQQKWRDPAALYFLAPWKNHYLAAYPIALPLIVSPLYIPVVYLFHLDKAPASKIVMAAYPMGKLCASLLAALSVVALYSVLVLLFGSNRLTFLITAAYALGTTLWSQASQHLLPHSFSCLMILATLAFFLHGKNHLRFLLLTGLCAALAVAERYNNVFFAAIITVLVVMENRKQPRALCAFFVFPIIVGGTLLWYNLHFFNQILGAYPACKLDSNFFTGLAGIMVSPSRGLFVYSPFLLASIAGIFIFLKKKQYAHYPVLAGMIVVIIANIVFVAKWASWWGGWSYGPRLLTEIVPLMVLFIPFVKTTLAASKSMRVLFYCSIGISMLIHGIGVFCYPKGMSNALPQNIDKVPSRLWNIPQNQILVEGKAGLYTEIFDMISRKLSGKATATIAAGPLPDSAVIAKIVVDDVPDTMKSGYSYRTSFSVTNHSKYTWPALGRNDGAYTISFSCYWKNNLDGTVQFDNSRTLLWDVAPGDVWHNDCVISAPPKKGTYIIGFDVFQTKVGWFHDKGVLPFETKVSVID